MKISRSDVENEYPGMIIGWCQWKLWCVTINYYLIQYLPQWSNRAWMARSDNWQVVRVCSCKRYEARVKSRPTKASVVGSQSMKRAAHSKASKSDSLSSLSLDAIVNIFASCQQETGIVAGDKNVLSDFSEERLFEAHKFKRFCIKKIV